MDLQHKRLLRFMDSNCDKQAQLSTDDTKDKVKISYNENTKVFSIYITDVITGPEDYTNVFEVLNDAESDETIKFFLSTPGGRLDTINKIRGLANLTQARTVAVVGDVASAGTVLALSFDEIIILDNIEFMIHNYSGGTAGKGHEIYAHVKFLEEEMPKIFKDYYNGFLTEDEMKRVINGEDIYLNATQVAERWDNVLQARRIEEEQMIKEFEEAQNTQLVAMLEAKGFTVLPPVSKTKKNKTKVNESNKEEAIKILSQDDIDNLLDIAEQ